MFFTRKSFIVFLVVFSALFLSACQKTPIEDLEKKIGEQDIDGAPNLAVDDLPAEEFNKTSQFTPQANQPAPQGQPTAPQNPNTQTAPKAQQATIATSKGNIRVILFSDIAPGSVANFIDKANTGFYQDLTFHRVEDWVIQGGDPSGNGTGGGNQPTELSKQPFTVGSLGVARAGDIKVSNDSQFFICTKDCNWLTGQYTNFGQVIEGMEVANSIQVGDTINSIAIKEVEPLVTPPPPTAQ